MSTAVLKAILAKHAQATFVPIDPNEPDMTPMNEPTLPTEDIQRLPPNQAALQEVAQPVLDELVNERAGRVDVPSVNQTKTGPGSVVDALKRRNPDITQ